MQSVLHVHCSDGSLFRGGTSTKGLQQQGHGTYSSVKGLNSARELRTSFKRGGRWKPGSEVSKRIGIKGREGGRER